MVEYDISLKRIVCCHIYYETNVCYHIKKIAGVETSIFLWMKTCWLDVNEPKGISCLLIALNILLCRCETLLLVVSARDAFFMAPRCATKPCESRPRVQGIMLGRLKCGSLLWKFWLNPHIIFTAANGRRLLEPPSQCRLVGKKIKNFETHLCDRSLLPTDHGASVDIG